MKIAGTRDFAWSLSLSLVAVSYPSVSRVSLNQLQLSPSSGAASALNVAPLSVPSAPPLSTAGSLLPAFLPKSRHIQTGFLHAVLRKGDPSQIVLSAICPSIKVSGICITSPYFYADRGRDRHTCNKM
jgi:hypothetical protein